MKLEGQAQARGLTLLQDPLALVRAGQKLAPVQRQRPRHLVTAHGVLEAAQVEVDLEARPQPVARVVARSLGENGGVAQHLAQLLDALADVRTGRVGFLVGVQVVLNLLSGAVGRQGQIHQQRHRALELKGHRVAALQDADPPQRMHLKPHLLALRAASSTPQHARQAVHHWLQVGGQTGFQRREMQQFREFFQLRAHAGMNVGAEQPLERGPQHVCRGVCLGVQVQRVGQLQPHPRQFGHVARRFEVEAHRAQLFNGLVQIAHAPVDHGSDNAD